MMDPDLNNKLDRLLTLLEAQLELTRQGHREERLQRAQLSREETMDLSHSEDQAGGGDESMIGDPHTPTPAPRPRRSVSFNLDEQEDINYEKYASPTGPRYVKTKLDPYSRTRTDPYPLDHEEDTSIMAELNRSKPIATPFPKFNPRDMEIFILEAEAWFKFNQVYEQSRMINHMGAQLEGTAREWWTSKLRIDRAREGRLFNDWHYFTERLSEQFNPRNARMEAYNKLLALRLTSDAPGAATRHVERFRDLEGQVNLDDNELVIDLFRGSLTRSIQEKFERNPPGKRWEWYRENWVSAKSKFNPHPTTHSTLSSSITITSNYTSNYTKPKPTPSSSSHPTLEARKPCSIRLWSPQQTPSRRPPTQEMATQAALRRVTPRPWTSAHTSNPWTPITRRSTMMMTTRETSVGKYQIPTKPIKTRSIHGITAGHVGRDATIKAAQRHYWWPNMTAWIADYVASCPVCARYKAPRHRPYGLLQPLATPDRPWGSISLDFIEGLPPSKKYDSKTYDSILVIVDRLTKFAILAPTHKTVTAKQTAVLLYGHMVRLFGYPDHMVSDRGRQFISGAWKAFAEQMGVKHSLSTAYHPQTDGQTERVNQVIEQYLRMYCNYEQNDWANLLDTAAFVYNNNTVHNSIGVSPFFACYGWNPKAHPDIPQRLGVNDPGCFEYLMDGKERCKYLQEQIREAQRRSVNQYNRKHKDIEFKVGDMVYINRRNWKTRRPTPKLDTRFAGPYPVQERVGHRAYRITLPANLRVHDVFHVSMLEPARTSSLPQRAEQPTIPSLPDEDLDFEAEALIDKRSHNGTTEYKVLWRGYSEEAASWEPVENLNCPDLIQEYEVSEGGRVSRQS
ncbi:hypothetical protein NDA17_001413 [Ustilago hordei]|nr:hypothetical protein NDA17_001413 [Ustilago hordei]